MIQNYSNFCELIEYYSEKSYLRRIQPAMDVNLASIIWQGRNAQGLKLAVMELV